MTKEEAKKIIASAFNDKFDENNFLLFVRNLFKEYKSSGFEPIIKHSFLPFILKYKVIGYFEDCFGNKIDILEVALNKNSTLERARTAQRNFVAEYLKTNNKEAALVAFVSPGNRDWRLSLVKLEHSLEVVNEKLKTKAEITPARRWSFLVGENEGSHTAQSRFMNLLISNENPNLSELELAFDIEVITKEFFSKYTELYFHLKECLDAVLLNDEKIKKEFEEKEISTVDFAKKTLGQIVFLYFLQKKGWFGVSPEKKWGEGPKKFIRELFERRKKYGKNFFNDVLEPLFYEALAQDRGKESIYPRLNNCRMPFLNGGLFEPMNGYKWETTNIVLPDDLFSNNNRTKEGDIGDGIFDIFDRYNFTVNENEPLEKEVAVDPEMLGKVFENLLDIKDRKSKGAFYTPREIVHYMCQESLINYLEAEVGTDIARQDLELLIRRGDRIIDNDKVALEKIREKEISGFEYRGKYELLLPGSIRSKAILLDQLLENIKIADPAVGSGAFPLGMINEIVRARKVLNIYLDDNISDYELKLHTISHSIYGVDLDPGAVEIAKLRLWLSLVVDENIPHPLPNLEHKIMQGNSLISEYEGIKLFDDSILESAQSLEKEKVEVNDEISKFQREYFDLHYKGKLTVIRKMEIEREIKSLQSRLKLFSKGSENSDTSSNNLFGIPEKRRIAEEKTKLLHNKIEQYISESRRTHKQELKEEIDNLKWELIEITLAEQGKTEKLEEIKELRRKNIRPFFIWKLEFSDVFREKGGFDVVIGNPPYIKEHTDKSAFDGLRESQYYQGKMDLWYLFACTFIDLLKTNTGVLAFIASNNWVTNAGASKLRLKIAKDAKMISFIDFGNYKIFESADIQTMIMLLQRNNSLNEYQFDYRKIIDDKISLNCVNKILNKVKDDKFCYLNPNFNRSYFENKTFVFSSLQDNNILNKISEKGKFFIDGKSELMSGIDVLQDFVNKKSLKEIGNNFKIGDGIFVLSNNEKENIKLSEKENKLLKPYYTTKELKGIFGNKKNKFWIIYTDSSFKKADKINDYPEVKKHLDKFKDIITSENGPYGLNRPRKESFFQGEKIMSVRKCACPTFTYTDFPCYVSRAFFSIKTSRINQKYLTGILNSKLIAFWLHNKGKMQGNNYQIDKDPIIEIPIFIGNKKEQEEVISIVERILDIKRENDGSDIREFELQIDKLIFGFYGLTMEEVEVVNNCIK